MLKEFCDKCDSLINDDNAFTNTEVDVGGHMITIRYGRDQRERGDVVCKDCVFNAIFKLDNRPTCGAKG